jgi:nitrite reductase (NADH) small subunit
MTMSTATYNLGPVACIPLGEGRLFETGDTLIAIFRARDGRVYATEPWCPHRGGPLIDGIVAAGKVVCPLHGSTFDLTTGKPSHSECRAIRTFPVRLSDEDEVLVTMRRSRLGHCETAEPKMQKETETSDIRADAGPAEVVAGAERMAERRAVRREANRGDESDEVASADV